MRWSRLDSRLVRRLAPSLYGRTGEESTTNLFTFSDPTAVDATNFPVNGNVTYAAGGVPGFTGAVAFGDNSLTRNAYKKATLTVGLPYVLSVFVKMDDGLPPVTANASSGAGFDFSLLGEGSTGGFTVAVYATQTAGVYRVAGTRTATVGTLQNWGVIKATTQSARTFKVTGYQLEQKSRVTAYLATAAAAVTRLVSAIAGNGKGYTTTDRLHLFLDPPESRF